MYALIEFAGKQFKVEEGNSIKVPHIDGMQTKNIPHGQMPHLQLE